jgi:hypothetical protein
MLWAQATGVAENSLGPLALRRWFVSLTLSSPEAVPSLFGLWAWLAGLAGLLVIAMIAQGPLRALQQFFDIPAHLRILSESIARLRRSGRVVAVTIGLTVVAWTASQLRTYNQPQGRDDLMLLMKSRGVGELAVEQGVMAGLTSMRDVFGLGNNLPLVMLAVVVFFRASMERWGAPYVPPHAAGPRASVWGTVAWCAGSLYVLYRLVSLASGTGDLPAAFGLVVEVLAVPALAAIVDGTLLAWILVELRNASLGDTGNDTFEPEKAAALVPGSVLACVAALPARYLATVLWLVFFYLPPSARTTTLGGVVRWQLSSGLADLQGAALLTAGMAGAVAWSRGTPRAAIRGYFRLLAAEGGSLAAITVWSGLAAGAMSAVAYFVVLSLPTQTWVLPAADSYSHYATLPVGLVTLAAFVGLGERSLPTAALVEETGASHES